MEAVEKKYLFAAATLTMGIVWAACLLNYNKLSPHCHWFGINIFIYSIVAILVVIIIFSRLEWFRQRYGSTSGRMFVIAVAGFVLSILMGIVFTEPQEISGYGYDYSQTRSGYYYYYFGDILGYSADFDAPDVDLGDDNGEAIAILLLVILVVILIVASAFVPHFWVLAGAVLLGVMAMITYRELTLMERPAGSGEF